MTVEEIKAFFSARAAAFAARDVPALVAGFTEDCVVESPTSGTWVGRAAVERRYRRMFAAAPDVTIEQSGDLLVMGDEVVVVGTVRGTDSRGKRFAVPNVLLVTLRDGQIVRQRYVNDALLQRVEEETEDGRGDPAGTPAAGRIHGRRF